MIPRIYDNSFTTYESNGLGLLVDAISCQVEEESNGDFELTLVYPSDGSFFYALKQDNLIKADASDTLKGQLFRIDTISKPLNGQVTVYAKHISFDLAKNSLNEDINERNINCENAGKHMLQKSDADSRFSIESNIEMLGNYSMDRKTDCLSAIAGTRGSLIDTFGNGPKLLRDNFTISVLNRRGKDDNTLIAYKKNITGFTLEEDYSEIINIIKPYATVTDEEGNESSIYIDEIGVKTSRYVEGDIIKSQWIDFSDKFDEDETPTKEKLKNLAEKYFNDNSCDLPKMTYKIEFQPLSQTEEYKEDGLYELEHIGMDDSVYIVNSKYGIRDQARVIKTTYNVLAEKYISIELGDPKTTLGSIINKSNNDTVTKDEVKEIIKNNKKDYPNTLPAIPVITIDRAGFKTISLSWTFDNKPYYSYQVYASQEQGFNPNAFDLIYEGKGSAFLHEVECAQTWYYKVRAVNTYGNSTDFSEEVSATTTKISDAAEYFQEAAIESALIGSLNADVINAGKLKGTFIDARNLSVTDGNGNVTFSVGSDAIVRMIQGLIDISDEGIRINLEDSENNIVGYVVYDGQGVQIFTNDDEPISSFHREGSYAEKFVTDRLICPAVVQVADSNGCPLDWYIGNTATGDRTGRDQNNKADSLSTVLRNIKNYGTKFDAKLTIHVEDGCVINEKGLVIQDMMGTVFRLELGPNVVINCEYFNIEDLSSRIFIEYVSDKRLVGGEITQADYNKYPIINSTSDDSVISVRHVDYIEIRGIRFEGVEGATGIKGLAGTNLVVDDCDFFGVDQCLKADGSSNVSLGWCSGNVDKLASIYNGSILTTSRRIPKYSNEEMVYVAENAIFIKSQYSYVQYDTLHSSSGSSSGGSGTNLNDVFSIPTSNLYTMVEGTGKVTSARKGYTGQGKYKTLKAHRGYIKLPITSIQSVMANKKSYTLKLKLTRLNTEHGYNSKTPHPIFRATGGSAGATDYWDSNVRFARGETQTLTLPTSIVQAIEKGADTLELWASSNQAQQYAFFGDIVLSIEGENISQGDNNKPGTDVGSGETPYSAVGTTTTSLNVRKGAGSSYAIITTLPQGTKVNIVAKDNATGWYKITYNGAYGYVSNKYVTITSTGTTIDPTIIQDFPYADEMVEVGLTYWRVCDKEYTSGQSWSQGFTYRSANTPLSGTCVADQDVSGSLWETVTRSNQTRHYKAIDCSTFAGMMTKGLEYVNGPYANKTNFTNFRKNILQKSSKKWAFNMVKADGTWAREAAAQCEYFDRVGLGIVYYRNVDTGKTYGSKGSTDDNFSPIKKGDLIFYSKKDSSGNWKQPNRYMKVSHVAVCYGDNSSGKKSVIESTNGTMSKNHTFDDGTTINAGIRIVSIAGTSGYADDIVMVVRPQPSHYNGNIPGGGTESGGTGGGTTGDGVTDAGTTEYTNCVSEQGTIDGNKYVYKLKQCKITAYGGDSGSACNIPLNLGKTCGSFNLPYGTKIYIPSLKGKRITDGNGKTVTCDGIFTVNDTGVGGTDFDLYMSTKSDTNAENIFGNTRREDVYILSYGSGYGYAWSYTQSYKWAYDNGTLSAYKVAFKDYIKYGGTLINFLKFKNDDANIRSSTYWSILNS
ncbi:MAG: phage tail spike protein [Intestinibacter bartlettii]|uniref:phage tail spike protein n=1 Tax=Intestinibacter bartlettii TaxID=261299 RepID=UPI0039A1FF07